MIDKILRTLALWNCDTITNEDIDSAKAELLAEILKGAKDYSEYWRDGKKAGFKPAKAIPVQYIEQLFNVEEK